MMDRRQWNEFATRYAAAWSSQDPDLLASFYAEDGKLTVNAGEPSVGRMAIAAKARDFMTAFPDMLVRLDWIECSGTRAVFHWVWTGTNSCPGGTGRSVALKGYEEWSLDPDGLIEASSGHYDASEYARQIGGSG
jgi:steroid delta-isomerase-like uncharacterized protein